MLLESRPQGVTLRATSSCCQTWASCLSSNEGNGSGRREPSITSTRGRCHDRWDKSLQGSIQENAHGRNYMLTVRRLVFCNAEENDFMGKSHGKQVAIAVSYLCRTSDLISRSLGRGHHLVFITDTRWENRKTESRANDSGSISSARKMVTIQPRLNGYRQDHQSLRQVQRSCLAWLQIKRI